MEQHEAVNRLYWLGRNGLWTLVYTCREEVNLNVEVRRKMGASMPVGIKGYSRIHAKYWDGWQTHWYEHKHCGSSFTRSLVEEDEVPKPIRLLEMLCE